MPCEDSSSSQCTLSSMFSKKWKSPQCGINRSLLNKLCCSHSIEHREDFRKSRWAIYTKSCKIHDNKKENSTHSISPSDSPLVRKKPSFLRDTSREQRKRLWLLFCTSLNHFFQQAPVQVSLLSDKCPQGFSGLWQVLSKERIKVARKVCFLFG